METVRLEMKKSSMLIVAAIVGLALYVSVGFAYTQFIAHEIGAKQQALDVASKSLGSTLVDLETARKTLSDTQEQLTTLQNRLDRITQILNVTPSPVILENQSSGTTYFYADGLQVCTNSCIILVRPGRTPHFLEAFTYYGNVAYSQPYQTPKIPVSFEPGSIHRYLACGMMGSLGSNCGFF